MELSRLRGLVVAPFVLAAFGCGAEQALPRTELLVVVDSDLSFPSELDTLQIRIEGPGMGDVKMAESALPSATGDLPSSLALVHRGGPLAPLHVVVSGRLGGSEVIRRDARVAFSEGKTLVLPMHLVHACLTVTCAAEQTCSERGCESQEVDSNTLLPWTGETPRLRQDGDLDAGAPADAGGALDTGVEGPVDASSAADAQLLDGSEPIDAGLVDASSATDAHIADAAMCMPVTESCNNRDDDCDGVIDNGFNLKTDLDNCGRCGTRCNTRRGEMCCAGSCVARACP